MFVCFLCSDPEAVLKKVQNIEELIVTVEGLAKETEVGAGQWAGIVYCWLMISIFFAANGHVQSVSCLQATQFGG